MDTDRSAIAANNLSADAQASWVDYNANYLFRFAYSRVGDAAAAEDLVQDTFLSAVAGPGNFAGRSTLRTWLTGILKHKIIDHFRLSVRVSSINDSSLEDELFDENGHWRPDTAPADWGRSPEELLADKEFDEILGGCINHLPPNLATVFRLREVEGLPADEICEMLSITSANYWVILHRARLQLRNAIAKSWQR